MQKHICVKTQEPMTLTDSSDQSLVKFPLTLWNNYVQHLRDIPTYSEYKYHFNEYCLTTPIQNPSTCGTADKSIISYNCKFGVRQGIIADQGINLVSSRFRSIARRFKASQYKITAFHPQCNGSIKQSRTHRISKALYHP